MIFFSLSEITWMLLAAIALDWWIGDPKWLKHPVSVIGAAIRLLERLLLKPSYMTATPVHHKVAGILLLALMVTASLMTMWLILLVASLIHPWLTYLLSVWFISTTMACKGLKDAAMAVHLSLAHQNLVQARHSVSMIVGRDTERLDEREIVRATVETVAENTVDAFVSPIVYAFIGAAPFAMCYRTVNTLDSMVGYKNEKYIHFGWASARFDDLLNYLPARCCGLLLALAALILYGPRSGKQSLKAVRAFAHLHPSPNSGIPESAVAGALYIQLGGTNVYGTTVSERAKMGWAHQTLEMKHIRQTIRLLYVVSYLVAGGLLCLLFWQLFNF